MLPHAHAALQLLLHDGVLGHKAWRQTRETDLLDSESGRVTRGKWARSSRSVSAGIGVLGEIQSPGSVAGGREVWRRRFFLYNNPWCSSISRSVRCAKQD
jgi:hypothetical protein